MLSQNAVYHGNNLGQGNQSAFNEACHNPQMCNQAQVNLGLWSASAIAAGIELSFFGFALVSLIIGGAPLRGAFFAVRLAASEGTIDIASSGIAKIGQKHNATVPASFQAWLEAGMLSYQATKHPQILSGYLSDPVLSIPVRFKLKKWLQFYDKKAKSSLVWLIKLDIPSSSFHVSRKLMNRRGYFICKDVFRWPLENPPSEGREFFPLPKIA